jgi:hypothetical protein
MMSRSEGEQRAVPYSHESADLSTLVWPELRRRDLHKAWFGRKARKSPQDPGHHKGGNAGFDEAESSSSLLKCLNSVYRPALAEESAERRSAAFQMVCWGVAKW